MNDDHLARLVSDANPVPDLDRIDAHLIEVTIRDKVDDVLAKPAPVRVAGRILVTSAAVLVLASILGLALLAGGQNTSPTATEADPNQVGEEYVRARNSGDESQLRALFHPDVSIEEYPVIRGLDELPSFVRYLEIVDESLELSACSYAPVGDDSTVVTCSYSMTNSLITFSESPPVPGDLVIELRDGLITRVQNTVDLDLYEMSGLDDWSYRVGLAEFDKLFERVIINGASRLTPRLDQLEAIETGLGQHLQS